MSPPADVRHTELRGLIRERYDRESLAAIVDLLRRSGTFDFHPLQTGLYSAVPAELPRAERSGYGAVWVRDNVHVANALLAAGDSEAAARCVRSLARFFAASDERFRRIVASPDDARDPANRPHVRFDGRRLMELDEPWPHAQNDALGAFLWIFSGMLARGELAPEPEDSELLELFVAYLGAIRYWEDEDCGHWEELPKVSASSIGAVVAGLEALASLAEGGLARAGATLEPEAVRRLARRGRESLERILPSECVQDDPRKRRDHDAALLLLVHPFGVVTGARADGLVARTLAELQGEHGIRRYRGDSYWAPDYHRYLERERGVADPGETLAWRDALAQPGGEAQWCLFDPIVSAHYGECHRRTGDPRDLRRQTEHLGRALGQLTGEDSPHGALRCPEAYFRRDGVYVPNDQTPLLWTQANLLLALESMRRTVAGE